MKAVIVIILVLTIFLTACAITGSVTVDPNDQCVSLEGSAKDDCYNEVMKCSKIAGETVRNTCVVNLALSKKDAEVCNLITKDNVKGFCLTRISEIQNQPEICESISDPYWNDNCNYKSAVNNHEAVFCENIINLDQHDLCFEEIALATDNIHLCLNVRDHAGCSIKMARKYLNINYCNRIPKGYVRARCQYNVAVEANDVKLCDKVSISDVKTACLERFS
ncbi:MAG TPA: hypothetical protein VJI98_01885 [Candidatus Nanoarchaeia archaeon]|nr:hypothetical protein [Candidatus Nanoarchaeia archaeon]